MFARDCVVGPHKFLAHDRSRQTGKEHLWQWKRGVRKGTPDTQLIVPLRDSEFAHHIWFEFKAPGEEPDDDQKKMLLDLEALGDDAHWGVTIEELRCFWAACGVHLTRNAEYRAMVLDGLVDSRIAKAESRISSAPRNARPKRAAPRNTASSSVVRRAASKGILI